MTPRPVYLDTTPDPVFGYFNPAEGGGTAVLICPPFGWDELASYRVRYRWAEQLAQAGHPALRIDLPGTGDSAGSPRDPARLHAWVAAAGDAAAWLRAESGAARVALLGVGLGGIVGHLAAARGALIDDLVLWGVPARGKTFVRELRAFGRLNAIETLGDDAGAPALPDGFVEINGHVISAETADALNAVDLAAAPVRGKRVLLLDRDGVDVDANLRAALEEAGNEVTAAPGPGYGAMTSHPQRAEPPRVVFTTVLDWLEQAPSAGGEGTASAPVAELEALDVAPVRETPLIVEHPGGRLVGILAEPPARAGDTALVLLNAGAIRRSGPSRMWTELARRWAARGVPVLRIDLEGLGDSDGDEKPYADDGALYADRLAAQLTATLDELERRGVASRFVAGGLCSGAYWAFHALRGGDARLRAGLLVNLFAFFWDRGLSVEAKAPRPGRLLSPVFWGRAIRGRLNRERVRLFLRRMVQPRRRAQRSQRELLDEALTGFDARGQRAWLFLCRNEPLYERLERDGGIARIADHPAVELITMPGGDHTFRALWMQQALHDALDRAIEAEVALPDPSIASHGTAPSL